MSYICIKLTQLYKFIRNSMKFHLHKLQLRIYRKKVCDIFCFDKLIDKISIEEKRNRMLDALERIFGSIDQCNKTSAYQNRIENCANQKWIPNQMIEICNVLLLVAGENIEKKKLLSHNKLIFFLSFSLYEIYFCIFYIFYI